MSIQNPTVSVVMPVYNAAEYIREAINSILQQTYSDFELLIINDGSTDRSSEIINSYEDTRIRIINNRTNSGLAEVRNQGIREAKGQYIAWLDADDKSHSDRIMKQVNFMNSHQEVGVCGTWIKTIGSIEGDEWHYSSDPDHLRCLMLFDDPLATSSIILRKHLLTDNNLFFRPEYPPAEDFDMWERLSEYSKISNIPEILTYYRLHIAQTSILNKNIQEEAVWKIQKRQIKKLNIAPSSDETMIHKKIGLFQFTSDRDLIKKAESWLNKLYLANNNCHIYPEPAFSCVLGNRWFTACTNATGLGVWTWNVYRKSLLSRYAEVTLTKKIKFLVKCLLKWNKS